MQGVVWEWRCQDKDLLDAKKTITTKEPCQGVLSISIRLRISRKIFRALLMTCSCIKTLVPTPQSLTHLGRYLEGFLFPPYRDLLHVAAGRSTLALKMESLLMSKEMEFEQMAWKATPELTNWSLQGREGSISTPEGDWGLQGDGGNKIGPWLWIPLRWESYMFFRI